MIYPVAAGLLSLFIVSYPLFNTDLYWHLANGRAMVAARRIINSDVLSYTHFGQHFTNHEWLSQLIFYLLWHAWGPFGLFFFKLFLCSLVVVFVYRSALIAGGNPRSAATLTVLAVLAGMRRYHIRPELFSLLGIAALGYIFLGCRRQRGRSLGLWAIPLIFIVWDWLHGAVVGLLLLCVVVGAENLKRFLPDRLGETVLDGSVLKKLNTSFALTLVAVVLNPYGLRTYSHFMVLALGARGAGRIVELQPVWASWGEYLPFIFLALLAVVLIVIEYRHADPTKILLVTVFGLGALRFSRLTGVSAVILAPVIVSLLKSAAGRRGGGLVRFALGGAVLVIAGVGFNAKILGRAASMTSSGAYILPSETAFGISVDEFRTPTGSARFAADMNLQGNMYNNANLGGYLAFFLGPDRRIFQYNMPPVFGDVTRFTAQPKELARWNVEYAFVSSRGELTKLFPLAQWAPVFNDYVSTLLVKRTPEHRGLIDKYEVRYFTPEQPAQVFQRLAADPAIRPRLAFEMGVYLAYMKDARVAERWRRLLEVNPELLGDAALWELSKRTLIP